MGDALPFTAATLKHFFYGSVKAGTDMRVSVKESKCVPGSGSSIITQQSLSGYTHRATCAEEAGASIPDTRSKGRVYGSSRTLAAVAVSP